MVTFSDHGVVDIRAGRKEVVLSDCFTLFLQEAEATCSEEDAHLVSIVTIAEDSFVWVTGHHKGLDSLWTGLCNKKVNT